MSSPKNSIEVFQDLYLSCSGSNACALPATLGVHVMAPWRHARDAEDQMANTTGPDAELYAVFVADHRAEGSLSSHNLYRWLVEVEDWPLEEAHDLISDRDKAVELLEQYDRIAGRLRPQHGGGQGAAVPLTAMLA